MRPDHRRCGVGGHTLEPPPATGTVVGHPRADDGSAQSGDRNTAKHKHVPRKTYDKVQIISIMKCICNVLYYMFYIICFILSVL